MRIGIDARIFGSGHTGLGRYTEELIAHLIGTARGHQFVAFVRPDQAGPFPSVNGGLEVRHANANHYSLREQVALPKDLHRAGVDLMHFPHFNVPLSYRGPFVASIHDLILLSYRGRTRGARLLVPPMRLLLGSACRRSAAIITGAEHQKRAIVEQFDVDPAKVTVIYHGVSSRFRPQPEDEVAALRQRLGVTGAPLLMYVGQWREHRNVAGLVKAFARVREQVDARLMLVGSRDRAFSTVSEAIATAGVEEHVVLPGFVPDHELPAFYAAADVFVFPSLMEGFGLPPLEAMRCGTPVAASRVEPMPEVLGDAARYFDPCDSEDMAATVLELLRDAPLRAARREAGHRQAAKYTWERTAEATLTVYESVQARVAV